MARFLIAYEPAQGKEGVLIQRLRHWHARRLFQRLWVLETNSSGEIIAKGLEEDGARTFAVIEIVTRGQHVLRGADRGATSLFLLDRRAPMADPGD
jgi:hypothetical protein